MFSRFTFKQKFIAVICGFLLVFVASYKKTFRKTIDTKNKLSILHEKLADMDASHAAIFNSKQEIQELDDIIGGGNTNPEDVQQKILNFITQTAPTIHLVAIENVHINSKNEFLIYSNQITLEGPYASLVQLLYAIEKEFTDSRVVSVQLHAKKNNRTKIAKVYLNILFQNYDKK